MTVDELMQQFEETERLIAVYRNADEVIVGTQDQIYSRRGLINRTTFTAAEIGGQIVSILERRLVTMRAELENSAPNTAGKADDRQCWPAASGPPDFVSPFPPHRLASPQRIREECNIGPHPPAGPGLSKKRVSTHLVRHRLPHAPREPPAGHACRAQLSR